MTPGEPIIKKETTMSDANVARLEHVNLTVPDAKATAAMLCRLFGWHVRWEGPALGNGHTVHVGNQVSYLAVFTPPAEPNAASFDRMRAGHLNHVGVVVDDLDATEARVKAEGHEPYSHDDYEPGRRFYFKDENGIEFEVVSYGR